MLNSPDQKKILVVVESIDVEDSSGSKANVALIYNLKKLGFQLRVFHYTLKEVHLKDINCVAIKENRNSILFFLSRIERYVRNLFKIKLHKPLEKRFGFSFTLFNDRNSIIAALNNIDDFTPDLVLTLSKGGSYRPHQALLQLPKFHNRWMAYIHDPYPMHWYPPPYPWFEPGFKQKEHFMKEIALKTKYTAFPSKLLMEWMGNLFKPYAEKGMVIPHQLGNIPETSENFPLYFDPCCFNLVHAGNLLRGREPFGLIKGFEKFINDNPGAKDRACLIFLGGLNYYTPELLEYEKKIAKFKTSPEKLSFPLVQKIQQYSAVNIILEAKSEISPFLPGKFPHCVAANKPILLLGPPKSEVRRLLGDDYPFWSEIDDSNRISEVITSLYIKWKNDRVRMNLDRKDLEIYLSEIHLKEVMKTVFN